MAQLNYTAVIPQGYLAMILLVKISKLDQAFSFAHRSSVAFADFVPNLGSKAYANGSTLLLYTNVKLVASLRFSARTENLLNSKTVPKLVSFFEYKWTTIIYEEFTYSVITVRPKKLEN